MRDLRQRQPRFADQLLGGQKAPVGRDGLRSGADMRKEEPPELPLAHAEAGGELVELAFVERPFLDEAQGTRNAGGRARPGWRAGRRFRPAAQAGTKPCRFGCGRARHEKTMFPFRHPRRADRPAIDARGADTDEEAAVEARILGKDGAVATRGIERGRGKGGGLFHVRKSRTDGPPPLAKIGHRRLWPGVAHAAPDRSA